MPASRGGGKPEPGAEHAPPMNGKAAPRRTRKSPKHRASELPAGAKQQAVTPVLSLHSAETGVDDAAATTVDSSRPACSNALIAARAREAALAVGGVTAVGAGARTVTTYGLPGQSVRGVLVERFPGGTRVEVHVTARPVPLVALGESIRRAVGQGLADLGVRAAVDVCVDDLDVSA